MVQMFLRSGKEMIQNGRAHLVFWEELQQLSNEIHWRGAQHPPSEIKQDILLNRQDAGCFVVVMSQPDERVGVQFHRLVNLDGDVECADRSELKLVSIIQRLTRFAFARAEVSIEE